MAQLHKPPYRILPLSLPHGYRLAWSWSLLAMRNESHDLAWVVDQFRMCSKEVALACCEAFEMSEAAHPLCTLCGNVSDLKWEKLSATIV